MVNGKADGGGGWRKEMEWVKIVDEGSEVGRWKEWNGLMEREKGKELVRSGWPGGWYIEANDGKGR